MRSGWIKFRKALLRDGRVLITSRKCDVSRVTVIGGLASLWCLADEYADDDGELTGWKVDDVNREIGIENFCESLPDDWIDLSGEYVNLPEYQSHNSTTGKRRAQTAVRNARKRERDATNVTTASPRLKTKTKTKRKKKDIKKKSQNLVKLGSHVEMTADQIQKFMSEDGQVEFTARVKRINNYCAAHGKAYADYAASYRTFRARAAEDKKTSSQDDLNLSANQRKALELVEANRKQPNQPLAINGGTNYE